MKARLALLFALTSITVATAAEGPAIVIADANGTAAGTGTIHSITVSEADGGDNITHRLLVWTEDSTRSIYAQKIDGVTNLPLGGRVTVSSEGMTFTNGGVSYRVKSQSGTQFSHGEPKALVIPDATDPQRNDWLVVWPASLERNTGTGFQDINTQILTRKINSDSATGGLTLATANVASIRPAGEENALMSGRLSGEMYDVVSFPDDGRFVLFYEATTVIGGTSTVKLYANRLLSLGQPSATGAAVISSLVDGESALVAAARDTQRNQAVVTWTRFEPGIGFLTNIQRVPFDLIGFNTSDNFPMDAGFQHPDSAELLYDAPRDRYLRVGSSLVATTNVIAKNADLVIAPMGDTVVSEPPIRQYKPDLLHLDDIDVFLLHTEEATSPPSNIHWRAFDPAYTAGSGLPLTAPAVVTAPFARLGASPNTRSAVTLRRFVRNGAARVSILGKSQDNAGQIIATTFTPFSTDARMTVANTSGSGYLHGETALLHVTLDNRVPADGFAKLAVAHEPAVRLTFSEAALVPVISADICAVAQDGEAWLCRLTEALAADELREFDVEVETSAIATVAAGTTVTVTAELVTVSHDTAADNNSVVSEFQMLPVADLSLRTIDGDDGSGIVGGETTSITYAIGNEGPDTANGIAVEVVLPDGLTLTSATGCAASGNTGAISCTVDESLAAGSEASITLQIETIAVDEEVTNEIGAVVQAITDDSDQDNNSHVFTLMRVPEGEAPVDPDPVDPSDPSGPGDPGDPSGPGGPSNPDNPDDGRNGGGGGGAGFALLSLLAFVRRMKSAS